MSNSGKELYEFSRFRLDVSQRLLLRDGKPVPLADKAFDTLCVLVRQNGELVGKDELMREVWTDSIVEENNLDQKISMLRQALGDNGKGKKKFIETVRGHGYRFIPDIKSITSPETLSRVRPVISQSERKSQHSGSRFQTTRSGRVVELAGWHAANVPSTENIPAKESASTRLSDNEPSKNWFGPQKIRLLSSNPPFGLKKHSLFATLGLLLTFVAFTILYFSTSRPATDENAVISVAVLPFKPLASDVNDEMLELGLAEALISRLSSIKQLNIRPLSTVQRHVSPQQTAIAAGRELKVEAVLEGTFQKEGSLIRITARLLRVSDGKIFWTEQFDEQSGDILAIQHTVAAHVVESLQVFLSQSDRNVLDKRPTENAEAYKIYLKGRYYWNKRTPEGLQKSIEHFRSAIDLDPLFALAYAGVADSYILQSLYGAKSAHEVMPKARAAAARALEIDSQLAEAYSALAMVNFLFDYDWPGAEENFRHAIELKPNYATARQWYGIYLTMKGSFDDAIVMLKQAGELDPLSLSINTDIAAAYYFDRRHEDAIKQLSQTLELDPGYFNAHLHLGLNYAAQKKFDKAIAEFESVKKITAGDQGVGELAWSFAVSGQSSRTHEILRSTEADATHKPLSPTTVAGVYAALGDKEQALKRLDQAYQNRDGFLLSVKVDPMFDSLRDHPDYIKIIKQMNFD